MLAQGLPIRGAVIQATGDGYLPAVAARRLFGPDSERRRLWTVVARNHRFDGGAPAFAQALHDAVHWAADSTPEEPHHE